MTPGDPGRVAARPGATISLVAPGSNQGQGLGARRGWSVAALDRPPWQGACSLVADGCRHASWTVIESCIAADARFKGIPFSRNSGKKRALTVGLEAGRGSQQAMSGEGFEYVFFA
jgi:hypothetical protein